MRELLKMIIVLTAISVCSGGLLAYIQTGTKERIANQVLEFVKGPAIRSILEDAQNDPITDRFELKDGDTTRTFFVGVVDGEPRAVTLETFGKGYGGDVGLMVGIDVQKKALKGVGVTTHQETPGMGARAKSDPAFVAQFVELPIDGKIAVTQDGGTINAISGATITSRAASAAASEAVEIFKRLQPQIEEKLKSYKK
jgi:electron transport complex protein RnfG